MFSFKGGNFEFSDRKDGTGMYQMEIFFSYTFPAKSFIWGSAAEYSSAFINDPAYTADMVDMSVWNEDMSAAFECVWSYFNFAVRKRKKRVDKELRASGSDANWSGTIPCDSYLFFLHNWSALSIDVCFIIP